MSGFEKISVANASPNILEVEDLRTHFITDDGVMPAVDGAVVSEVRHG